ncbi:MAG: hypothetical protein GEV13_14270 [Rhodospirillales bacterium]|nr:hypothetical protein [Rhodospirillales bacterium]
MVSSAAISTRRGWGQHLLDQPNWPVAILFYLIHAGGIAWGAAVSAAARIAVFLAIRAAS